MLSLLRRREMSNIEVTPSRKFLTFRSPQGNGLRIAAYGTNNAHIYYSYDKTTWNEWDWNSTKTFSNTNPLYLCGDNPGGLSFADSQYINFVQTNDNNPWSCSGNIMSLISYNLESSDTTIPCSYCFTSLFKDCTQLTFGPLLPATTLKTYCYQQLFRGCTSLTQAPNLPATTLTNYCYYFMFQMCTSLTQPPIMPATTLATKCYSYMFALSGLTQSPILPATDLGNNTLCYEYMLYGTKITTAPELPATTLSTQCYLGMFLNCTNLINAPELPATILPSECYREMFKGCTALEIAPALNATSVLSDRYREMFYGCSSLRNIRCLATGSTGFTSWVVGVAETGIFTKAKNTSWAISGNGIPAGWTVIEV